MREMDTGDGGGKAGEGEAGECMLSWIEQEQRQLKRRGKYRYRTDINSDNFPSDFCTIDAMATSI